MLVKLKLGSVIFMLYIFGTVCLLAELILVHFLALNVQSNSSTIIH